VTAEPGRDWRHRSARLRHVLGSPTNLLLLTRLLAWAAVLPILKRTRSVTRLVALMTPAESQRSNARIERNAITLSRWIYRAPFVPDNCLERSLLAYRYLVRDGREHRLYLGIRADEGGYPGHAWLTVDGVPVHEPDESLEAYVPLVVFDGYGKVASTSARAPRRSSSPANGEERGAEM
jgi:hypothetical protein